MTTTSDTNPKFKYRAFAARNIPRPGPPSDMRKLLKCGFRVGQKVRCKPKYGQITGIVVDDAGHNMFRFTNIRIGNQLWLDQSNDFADRYEAIVEE